MSRIASYVLSMFRLLPIIIICNFLTGCFYYKISSSAYPHAEDLTALTEVKRAFVVHSGTVAFNIDSIRLENDSVRCDYVSYHGLPYRRTHFPDVNTSNRYYKRKGEKSTPGEVHFYLQIPLVPGRTTTCFALSDIYRFDIYRRDVAMTVVNSALAVGAGVLFIVSDVAHTTH